MLQALICQITENASNLFSMHVAQSADLESLPERNISKYQLHGFLDNYDVYERMS